MCSAQRDPVRKHVRGSYAGLRVLPEDGEVDEGRRGRGVASTLASNKGLMFSFLRGASPPLTAGPH